MTPTTAVVLKLLMKIITDITEMMLIAAALVSSATLNSETAGCLTSSTTPDITTPSSADSASIVFA